MRFDLNRATQYKKLIENGPIHNIITYAQRACPNECCGLILENGAIFPAQNVIETLGNSSLTTKNAFLIDGETWRTATSNKDKIACVYHSHINGKPDMSTADQMLLQWRDICYIIISLIDKNPTSAKLFWWENNGLSELDIKI